MVKVGRLKPSVLRVRMVFIACGTKAEVVRIAATVPMILMSDIFCRKNNENGGLKVDRRQFLIRWQPP